MAGVCVIFLYNEESRNTRIYIYIYMCVCVYICTYRGRYRKIWRDTNMYVSVGMYGDMQICRLQCLGFLVAGW